MSRVPFHTTRPPVTLPFQGHFPEAQHDPVIQIASLVTEMGKATPAVRNVMTLRDCSPIAGAGELGTGAEGDSARALRATSRLAWLLPPDSPVHFRFEGCAQGHAPPPLPPDPQR